MTFKQVALEALDTARTKIAKVFGGMGSTSAIWSNHPFDKGHSTGVTAALTALDKVRARLAKLEKANASS